MTLFSKFFLGIKYINGILFFLAIVKPFALELLETTNWTSTKLCFLNDDCISDSKFEPLPDMKIATCNFFN